MITQELLKSLLHYDPETGIFKWAAARPWIVVGREVGSVGRRGHVQINIYRKAYKAHRLAWLYMYGESPTKDLDHINGIKTDNRIANLREATRSENMQNVYAPCGNSKSGIRGVMWYKQTHKWHAQLSLNDKKIHIGFFNTKEEARDAYIAAKKRLHPFSTL